MMNSDLHREQVSVIALLATAFIATMVAVVYAVM
jgi:hypothetical protein